MTTLTEDQKYVLLECALVMNYGWKQLPNYQKDEECVICWDSMKNSFVLETACGHRFHDDCILTSISTINTRHCVLPECKKKF